MEPFDDQKDFAEKMREASNLGTEEAHIEMDSLLCAKLREFGYDEAVDIFMHTSKWYA